MRAILLQVGYFKEGPPRPVTRPCLGRSRRSPQSQPGRRYALVAWIEQKNGKAYVDDSYGHRVDVHVVTPSVGAKYLRTRKDGIWTDNLLALPRR